MNLRSIDLNLLVVFEAIVTERSISRAAQKVGLSQSAMSHALSRLRVTFNDDLVRRTARGMVPTPRALKLVEPVRNALAQIAHAVDEQVLFDPKTSKRRFNIRMSDYLAVHLMAGVCARVRAEAPQVTLAMSYPSSPSGLDSDADLTLLICSKDGPRHGFKTDRLYQGRFVAALRRGHPAAKKKMTLNRLLGLSHLRADTSATSSTIVDDALARRGLSRNIAITIPCLSGLIVTLQRTDLCAVLPDAWLILHDANSNLVTSSVPLSGLDFTVDLVGSELIDQDPGLRWLAKIIKEEVKLLSFLVRKANHGS